MKLRTKVQAGFALLAIESATNETPMNIVVITASFNHPAATLVGAVDAIAWRATHVFEDIAAWIEYRKETGAAWLAERLTPRVYPMEHARFWEVDAARGLAISMMLGVHFIESWLSVLSVPLATVVMAAWTPFKMAFIFGIASFWAGTALLASPTFAEWSAKIAPEARDVARAGLALVLTAAFGGWMAVTGSGSDAFMFIMGVSIAIASQRQSQRWHAWKKNAWRGAQLIGAGMGLTALSLLLVPHTPIVFGALHLLGVAMILATPFVELPGAVTVTTGATVIALGSIVPHIVSSSWLLLPFGFRVPGIAMLDYQPLFPYWGAVLMGLAAGKVLYPQGRARSFDLPDLAEAPPVRALAVVGRHALAVYLSQEPFLLLGRAALGAG